MSKKKTVAVKKTSPVAKGKSFVNNAMERAKSAGTAVKAAGAKAASHVSRNGYEFRYQLPYDVCCDFESVCDGQSSFRVRDEMPPGSTVIVLCGGRSKHDH